MIASLDLVWRPLSRALAVLAAAWPFAAPAQQPSFEGVWSGLFTTQDNEFWQVEDFSCFAGCSKHAFDRLVALLDDPANAATPLEALTGQFAGLHRMELAAKLTEAGIAARTRKTKPTTPRCFASRTAGSARRRIRCPSTSARTATTS